MRAVTGSGNSRLKHSSGVLALSHRDKISITVFMGAANNGMLNNLKTKPTTT